VLVISRAGIGPKSEEVCVQTRNGKGKKLFDDKRSNAKLFLALELQLRNTYLYSYSCLMDPTTWIKT
jgi:hypothetical protein